MSLTLGVGGGTGPTECHPQTADVLGKNDATFSPDFDTTPDARVWKEWEVLSVGLNLRQHIVSPREMARLHYVGKELGSGPTDCSGACCPCAKNETISCPLMRTSLVSAICIKTPACLLPWLQP